MMFIHYGTKTFDKNYEYTRSQRAEEWSRCVNKPIGCLWASPVKSKNNWKNFIESENDFGKDLSINFKFKLERDARVLVISKKTIAKVFERFGYTRSIGTFSTKMFDWKLIERFYDAVYVDVTSLRFGGFNSLADEYYLSCFDVDSVCVWNLEKVKVQ